MIGTLTRAWILEEDAHWKEAMETLRGRHVLLTEDNKTNQEIVSALLENSGIRVTIASDGQKAVNFMEAGGDVDLILMDIHMPNMNGYHATQKIREHHPAIPIIALTTDAGRADVARAKAAGMNDHLSKPIDVKKFYVVLWKYLGSAIDADTMIASIPGETASEEPLPVFDLIDTEEGLKRVLYNRKIYVNILKGLYAFRDIRLDTMVDPEEFRRTIHTIKGLSAGAGAHALYQIACELDATQDRNLIWEFYHAFNPVIDELRDKCIFDAAITPEGQKPPMTPSQRKTLFLELQAACATRRIRHVQPVISSIDEFALSPEDETMYNQVKMLVRRYKFKEAWEVLREAAENDFDH